MEHLVVVRPFGRWRVGDLVTEPAAVTEVLQSEHADKVVQVQLPEVN